MAKSRSTKKASGKELDARIGPVRKIVKLVKAKDTEASYNLHLACGHVRVGTKRRTLRCGRCRSAK